MRKKTGDDRATAVITWTYASFQNSVLFLNGLFEPVNIYKKTQSAVVPRDPVVPSQVQYLDPPHPTCYVSPSSPYRLKIPEDGVGGTRAVGPNNQPPRSFQSHENSLNGGVICTSKRGKLEVDNHLLVDEPDHPRISKGPWHPLRT